MESKASIKGHSIHRILVVFPITFFCTTLGCDVIFLAGNNILFGNVAAGLEAAGILSALAAALPGAIDYFYTVPPASSAHQRATKHAILNILLLAAFTLALWLRRPADSNMLIIVALETAGIVIMCFSGWLGGTLVGRNQIGIDHRYAGAGKWKEETIHSTSPHILLKDLDQLHLNQMKLFHIKRKRIVVANTENGFLAFDDRCSHRGGSLADGVLICGTVQCPWHGSQFSCKDGTVLAGPAKEKIKTYTISHNGKNHFLNLE